MNVLFTLNILFAIHTCIDLDKPEYQPNILLYDGLLSINPQQ